MSYNYNIKHSCGHWEEISLRYPMSDSYRAGEEGCVCSKCWEKVEKVMTAMVTEAGAKLAANLDWLPALKGSDKQITWAKSLRDRAIYIISAVKDRNGTNYYSLLGDLHTIDREARKTREGEVAGYFKLNPADKHEEGIYHGDVLNMVNKIIDCNNASAWIDYRSLINMHLSLMHETLDNAAVNKAQRDAYGSEIKHFKEATDTN